MKFSLKTIAAAVALATAAAGANAAIDKSNAATGSDLVLFTYSANSGYVTGMFDLGLSFDSIVTSAGVINSAFTTNLAGPNEIVWDLKNNSVSGAYGASASYVGATTGNWSTGYNEFMASTTGATDIRWAVIGVSKKSGTDVRALSTSLSPLGTVDNTTKSNTLAFSNVFDGFASAHNLIDANATDTVGSSSGNTSAEKASTSFGTSMNWATKASFNATAADKQSAGFFYLDTTSPTTTARAIQLKDSTAGYLASFTFDAQAGKLVYAVPEPESYAMFLAGLGLLGAIARRRVGK